MLKIKDNVDLKELEKYGFIPHYEVNSRTGESFLTHLYNTRRYNCRYGCFTLIPFVNKNIKKHYSSCIIDWSSKIINNYLKGSSLIIKEMDFIDLDILYDLIKANLVEKIDD